MAHSICPNCGQKFEIIGLRADEGNLSQYSSQPYFLHECVVGPERGGLPSAAPARKRKTYDLFENDAPSMQDDLHQRMIDALEVGSLQRLLWEKPPEWGYYEKGCVYAYLMDFQGFSAPAIATALRTSEVAVRVAKLRALSRFVQTTGLPCGCAPHHWGDRASVCPHLAGRTLFNQLARDLWWRVERWYWSGDKDKKDG